MDRDELKGLTDSRLLERYRSTGDNRFFQEIFVRYKGMIQSACLRFFHNNRSLADDAVQDTFLNALQGVGGDKIQHVRGWLLRIAMNSCIDIHRKERTAIFKSSTGGNFVQARLGAAETFRTGERSHDLIRMINELGQKQRICLKLYLEGYSYQEIGKMTHYTEKEIKSAIQTGKGNLKNRFGSESED